MAVSLPVCVKAPVLSWGVIWNPGSAKLCSLEMLFFTMMNAHSKSTANNTIQVPPDDGNTPSSFANITVLILFHFRENSLSNCFFNESVSVWRF